MKKVVSMFIAAVLALSLAACSTASDGASGTPPAQTGSATLESAEAPPAEQSAGQTQPDQQDVSISETVLVEESGIKITAKSLDTDGFAGAQLNLLIENNSGQNLTFQCRDASVNGYMVGTMMSVDIVTGKQANDSLTFLRSDLDACGIDTIADMEFSFHIFTTDGWNDYLDTDPIQLKTSAADTYEYTFDDSGDLVYDANGCKVVVKGLSTDASYFGPSIMVYIENNSEKNITLQSRDVSVNGFMIDPIFSLSVAPGKHAVSPITFSSSTLEENGISAIETAELSFHIFDSNTWDTIVDTDPITLEF